MRIRLAILVLGIALGLAARGAKWAYDRYTGSNKAAPTPARLTDEMYGPSRASGGI